MNIMSKEDCKMCNKKYVIFEAGSQTYSQNIEYVLQNVQQLDKKFGSFRLLFE